MAYKTPNKTSEYIRSLMKPESDPILAEIIDDATSKRIPILLPEAAAFVAQLTRLRAPKRVLEIGTAIGYSGLIFLKNSGCQLVTIDKNAGYLAEARSNFLRAGMLDRCKIMEGEAESIVPMLRDGFDLIFLDGPKTKYVEFLPILAALLNDNGILLADNVLFNGMVSGENEMDPKKKNIVTKLDLFLRQLFTYDDLSTSVLNVGDGISLSIKKKL